MNIIQLQDRLKGLPEETIVSYVTEPAGDVPIFLALSELQRRNRMKDRYEASKAGEEIPTISDREVAKSGIARMAPQQMMPGAQGVSMPPPAPQIDPRQMAASGIAANPVSNVGGPAMMAKGGIVGEVTNKMGKSNPVYEDGSIGALAGFAVPPVTSAVLGLGSLLGRGVMSTGRYLGNKISPLFRAGRAEVPAQATGLQGAGRMFIPGVTAVNPGYLRQPGALIDLPVLGGLTYGASQLFGGDPEPEDNKDDKDGGKKEPKKEPAKQEKKTLEDRVKEYMDAMGTNEGLERVKGRLAEFDERAKGKRGDAANMALIEAGLNIAAGQSPDALSNIATGATAGVKGYTERLKDADAAEKEVLALDLAIGQAERAERQAAVTFGMKSIETERAAQQKLGLIQYKAQLEARIKGSLITPDVRRKIREDLIADGVMDRIEAQLKDSMGENRVGTKEFNDAAALMLENEIQKVGLGPVMTGSGEDYSGFTIKR
jgi:hypothetical protein|tara:strand:+ start:1344 stop:2807 length:1464 start_codon:yes stop_codon:yes gene_type:complete